MLGFLESWGFFWSWKRTFIRQWMNFNSPILFPWWLKAKFFTRCFYFYHNENKEEQKSTLQIFLKDVTEKKNVEIHKELISIIWIFKKLNSLKSNYLTNYLQSKTTFWAKLSHSITRNLIVLNKFVSLLCLSSFRFELSRVSCSCFHFFSLAG